MGVNFGTGIHGFDGVGLYTDDQCQQGYGGPSEVSAEKVAVVSAYNKEKDIIRKARENYNRSREKATLCLR